MAPGAGIRLILRIVRPLRLSHLLLDWIAPDPCLGCGARPAVQRAPHRGSGLCLACRGRLRPAPPARQRCATCGRPLDAPAVVAGRCGGCRADPPPFDRLVYGWVFEEPIVQVVWGLKYRRLDYLAAAWAEELFERVATELPPLDAVVAVPLHWRRWLTRGYNQAVLLAAPLARRLGVPRLPMRRRRPTAAQTTQSGVDRRRNLQGAFAIAGRVNGLRLLLVDDVATTGSTLRAAAGALRRAGAAAVTALVLARTPEIGAVRRR